MQYALQRRVHLPKIMGDSMPYFIILVPLLILLAYMLLTSKNEKLSDEWSLRSYCVENLTFGAGLIIFVAAGFIMEGVALTSLTHQDTGVIYAYFIIGISSIVGFAIICMYLRGRFFITRRFITEINGKDLANYLTSSGLDCTYSKYSGIKCGEINMKVLLYSKDPWKNEKFGKITLSTITEDNATIAKRIIKKMEDYEKSIRNQKDR